MTPQPILQPPSPAASTRPAVLAMTGVTKDYRMGAETVRALQGINLRIEQGEFVSIMGPSGSGKSTLLHLMGALDRPTAGNVFVDGHDASTMSDNQLARLRGHRIGFVFQSFNLHPMLDALQNVEFPMMAIGVPRDARRKRAADLLKQVGLGDRLGHTPAQLSGGQKQRVAIARALANDPAYILADEPTGNLDSKAGGEILGALRYLHGAGKTIVVVTHDPNVAKLTGRTINLLDGRVEAKRP